jgi:NTE family protein
LEATVDQHHFSLRARKCSGFVTLFVLAALSLSLAAAMSGCAGTKRASQSQQESQNQPQPQPSDSPQVTYGPAAPYGPEVPAAIPMYGPVPQVSRAVVLVLGPGMARGYAYEGVIRALTDAKIKIGAIFGTEMGALIGALYARDGSVNDLEWGVQRFKDDVFQPDSSMFSRLLNKDAAEKLDESLDHVFEEKDLADTKIPMKILAQPAGAPVKVFDHGSLKLLVRAALGGVNGLTPVEIDHVPTGTAGSLRPFDVEDAKALGIGPVIVVNLLDQKESDLYPEMKQADVIIHPEMKKIASTDFKKRTDAVFAGHSAVQAQIEEIKRLVGGGGP